MFGCELVTAATTEIPKGWPPATATVMVPEYVPGAKCDGSAVTARAADWKGPAELAEDIFSQFPPEFVEAEAENATALLP
jgi:hypothetical protein